MEIAGHPYPAELQVDTPDHIARWRPLVQWLLAIPHMVVLWALGYVSAAVAIISWFFVVITGKLPAGLAGLQTMYLRYENRVYSYAGFLREDYPPFAFETVDPDPGTYPGVDVDFASSLEGRNRVTTAFRILLAIPQLIVVALLGIAAMIAHLIALVAVVVTGQWPEGLRKFVVGVMRWTLRVNAYWLLLTDEYPPFSLED